MLLSLMKIIVIWGYHLKLQAHKFTDIALGNDEIKKRKDFAYYSYQELALHYQ